METWTFRTSRSSSWEEWGSNQFSISKFLTKRGSAISHQTCHLLNKLRWNRRLKKWLLWEAASLATSSSLLVTRVAMRKIKTIYRIIWMKGKPQRRRKTLIDVCKNRIRLMRLTSQLSMKHCHAVSSSKAINSIMRCLATTLTSKSCWRAGNRRFRRWPS